MWTERHVVVIYLYITFTILDISQNRYTLYILQDNRCDSNLLSNKNLKFHLAVGAQGQVTRARMVKNLHHLCHPQKPKT